jgi:serralysin
MMVDIYAIQSLYGAPGAAGVTAGDTVFGQGSSLGNYLDPLFDWFATGTPSALVTVSDLSTCGTDLRI